MKTSSLASPPSMGSYLHPRVRGDRQLAQPAQRPPKRLRRQHLPGLQPGGPDDDRLPRPLRAVNVDRVDARLAGAVPGVERPHHVAHQVSTGRGKLPHVRVFWRETSRRKAPGPAPLTSATARIATPPTPATRPDHPDRGAVAATSPARPPQGHQPAPCPRRAPPAHRRASGRRGRRGSDDAGVARTASTPGRTPPGGSTSIIHRPVAVHARSNSAQRSTRKGARAGSCSTTSWSVLPTITT